MGPGEELALLEGIAVDRIGHQVGPNAAVVEKCVALARSTVAGDRPALRCSAKQEREQVRFDLEHVTSETGVAVQGVEPGGGLILQYLFNPDSGFGGIVFGARIDPQRTSVGV